MANQHGQNQGQGHSQQPPFDGNQYSNQNDPGLVTVEQYQLLVDENVKLTEQYSQIANNNKQLVEEMAQANRAIANLEARVVDSDRSQRIQDLYQLYPHFIVVEEELDTVLYSRGGEMSNEQFEAHCDKLEKYAQRSSPVSKLIPRGVTGADQYSRDADVEQLVVDRYTALADQGIHKSYDEVKREILAESKSGQA